jgi:hypothetical protein
MTSDESVRSKAAEMAVVRAVIRKPISRNALCRSIEETVGTALPAAATEPGIEKRRMRVLSAEDNKTNRLVLKKLLRPLEIDLEFAFNGLEAVEKYGQYQPDLILMDISMPQMDGKEATRQIRQLEQDLDKHTPIVALTALAGSGDEEDIRAAGLDEYLTKPVRRAEVFGVISGARPEDAANPFLGEDSDDQLVQLSG